MADAVLVTPSFLPGRGGIETYLASLCSSVAPRLAVLAPARRDDEALPELPYPTIAYKGRMWWPGLRLRSAIERSAREQDTNRILFGTPWPVALAGPAVAERGLSYAVIVHGAEFLVASSLPFASARLADALSGADLLLTVSDYTGNTVQSFLEQRGRRVPPTVTLRPHVDLQRFHPDVETELLRKRLCFDEDTKVVLCFGRLVRRKGIDRLIACLPEIARGVPEVALVVAGTGPEEARLRRLAAHVPQTVVFAGRVPAEEAPSYYALADVFALPVVDRWFGLETEGLGVVLLEAAASGTPCVTGRSGGTPEAVVDRESGFVIDARNSRALARSVTWLLEHPEEARQMGEAGRRHVEKSFSGDLPPPLVEWLDSPRSPRRGDRPYDLRRRRRSTRRG